MEVKQLKSEEIKEVLINQSNREALKLERIRTPLLEFRMHWEFGLDLICDIPDCDDCFYSILSKTGYHKYEFKTRYYLHRYFKVGDIWQASVDLQTLELLDILLEVNTHKFKTEIPK